MIHTQTAMNLQSTLTDEASSYADNIFCADDMIIICVINVSYADIIYVAADAHGTEFGDQLVYVKMENLNEVGPICLTPQFNPYRSDSMSSHLSVSTSFCTNT